MGFWSMRLKTTPLVPYLKSFGLMIEMWQRKWNADKGWELKEINFLPGVGFLVDKFGHHLGWDPWPGHGR